MKKIISSLALTLAAFAASAGPIIGTCSIADIAGAYACSGAFSGNDTGNAATINTTLARFQALDPTLVGFHLVDKSDGVAGTQEVTITSTGSGTGTLTLNDPSNLLDFSVFGISLKAGDFYSLYLFDGGLLANNTSFAFTTTGVVFNDKDGNKVYTSLKDERMALSHASLWGFSPSNFGDSCGIGNGACDPTTTVPEPASLALVGAGLFAVGFARRKTAK